MSTFSSNKLRAAISHHSVTANRDAPRKHVLHRGQLTDCLSRFVAFSVPQFIGGSSRAVANTALAPTAYPVCMAEKGGSIPSRTIGVNARLSVSLREGTGLILPHLIHPQEYSGEFHVWRKFRGLPSLKISPQPEASSASSSQAPLGPHLSRLSGSSDLDPAGYLLRLPVPKITASNRDSLKPC